MQALNRLLYAVYAFIIHRDISVKHTGCFCPGLLSKKFHKLQTAESVTYGTISFILHIVLICYTLLKYILHASLFFTGSLAQFILITVNL